MRIIIKEGAIIKEIPEEMIPVLSAISMAWKLCRKKEVVITSGSDDAPNRNKYSLHPLHLAYDLRTRDLSAWETKSIVKDLKIILGRDYDVVLEPTHIHIEYDKKQG